MLAVVMAQHWDWNWNSGESKCQQYPPKHDHLPPMQFDSQCNQQGCLWCWSHQALSFGAEDARYHLAGNLHSWVSQHVVFVTSISSIELRRCRCWGYMISSCLKLKLFNESTSGVGGVVHRLVVLSVTSPCINNTCAVATCNGTLAREYLQREVKRC